MSDNAFAGYQGQGQRSDDERKLPQYALHELDMARQGYDLFGNKITEEQARAVFAMHGIIR